MNLSRRELFPLLASTAPAFAQSRPKVAITMDDVRWQLIPEGQRAFHEQQILEALGDTHACLFAVGEAVANPHGSEILAQWSSSGHWIGNHTYTHVPLFRKTDPAEFEAGILLTESVLKPFSGFHKWFRFPALKEGATPEVRDRLRAFLGKHGYRNGAVTIDASDWYYNQRLLDHLKVDPEFDARKFRQPYLDHIWDRAQYYDQLARDVLGRGVKHTLLIHYNLLNALFLGDLLTMFRKQGWEHIGADEAFADPIFEKQPRIAPAGESLIWALAKETGKFESRLRYPGEDDVYEKPLLDKLGL